MLGSGVIRWSGMKTVGDSCDFGALPYLIVISQILVPLAVGIPATLMLPNVSQSEHIIDWEKEEWFVEGAHDLDTSVKMKEEEDEEGEAMEKDPRLSPHYLL
jgi:hypothetical protein